MQYLEDLLAEFGMCETFHVLPRAGGMEDQDPIKFRLWKAILEERNASVNAKQRV